jgi:hypothetical protein
MKYIKLFEKSENQKLYPVGTKVICIRKNGSSGLIEGKEYEIESVNDGGFDADHYYIKGEGYFIADRFLTQIELDMKKYNL